MRGFGGGPGTVCGVFAAPPSVGPRSRTPPPQPPPALLCLPADVARCHGAAGPAPRPLSLAAPPRGGGGRCLPAAQ